MQNILITGGFGFIGSWLAEKLLGEGHAVHIVDNLSSNLYSPATFERIWDYPANLTYTITDVADFCDRPPMRRRTYEQVYHLASPVGPAGVLNHAGSMASEIIEASRLVTTLARRRGARLVFVSTSEVYGGGEGGLCAEDMPKHVPAEPTVRLEYAVAKLAAEIALMNTCAVYPDFWAAIVRPFNVAGPRQNEKGGFVLPRFIRQALTGEKLTVFGNGRQVRAFTHVADIVDGLTLVMERGGRGEVYNLGNPVNRTTILTLAADVLETLTTNRVPMSAITFTDGRAVYGPLYAEAADKYPDATKAMNDLGWRPTRGIRQTIRDTAAAITNAITIGD